MNACVDTGVSGGHELRSETKSVLLDRGIGKMLR